MNVQSGKNENHKYSLPNSSSRSEEHLRDFILNNRLTCLNTKFQKRKGKLWIYTYANNSKAHIKYVFMNKKKLNYSALNREVYLSFEVVSSDHWIVKAKIPLCLRRKASRKTTLHYNCSLLNNRCIRDKYTLPLRIKIATLQEISETPTPNNEYENFVNAHSEAATERIPSKQGAKLRVSWETLAVRKKREDAKTASKCNCRTAS